MPFDMKITVDTAAVLQVLNISEEDMFQQIADKVADEVVLPRLAKYPSPSHKKQPFRSTRQRQYFFAALKSGAITVPYRRTGDLSGSWAKQPFRSGVAVTSSSDHAEMVVGVSGKQSDYFKGTWPNVEQVALESEQDAALVATSVIVDMFINAGA